MVTQKFRFQAHRTSDLAALQVGDHLSFAAVKVNYASDAPLSRLKTPGRLGGILLSIHLLTEDSHRIQGCAVIVAPGVALCASHVFEDDREGLATGKAKVLCVGTAEHGNQLWNVSTVTPVPGTEICILSLSLIDGLPPDRTFPQASITTRWPRRGERLVLVAFKADEEDTKNWKPGNKILTYTLASAGRVTQHFPDGRGRMLPGPCMEVDFESWLGMSGGPVFDESGWLVGVLSSSLSTPEGNSPSFVSHIYSALAYPFRGGWLNPGPDVARTLLNMTDSECVIEKRDAVRPTYLDDGRVSGCICTTWHDR